MELDELRNRARTLRAPVVDVGASGKPVGTIDDLVNRLRAQDEQDRRRLRRLRTFFGIAAVFYAAIFILTWILPPDGPAETSRLVLGLYTVIFAALATKSIVEARRIASIDYSSPVGSFLQQTERRYRLVNWQEVWLFMPIFVIAIFAGGLGWMNGVQRYQPELDRSTGLILYGILLAIVVAGGAVIGRAKWKKKRAPILEEIRRLQAELGSGK
jgi:hypothetical protein